MQKRIVSHVTIYGQPACTHHLPWRGHHGGGAIKTCGFLSFNQARIAARDARHWAVRAVKGNCPISEGREV